MERLQRTWKSHRYWGSTTIMPHRIAMADELTCAGKMSRRDSWNTWKIGHSEEELENGGYLRGRSSSGQAEHGGMGAHGSDVQG